MKKIIKEWLNLGIYFCKEFEKEILRDLWIYLIPLIVGAFLVWAASKMVFYTIMPAILILTN